VRHRLHNEVRAAWSEDGGRKWQTFVSEPPDGEGAGRIRIASDGGRVLWHTLRGSHWYTDDHGRHWHAVRGLPDSAVVIADTRTPAHWYAYDAANGALLGSDDGGASFVADHVRLAPAPALTAELRADPQQPGLVYVGAGPQGLLRWREGELQRVAGVDVVHSLGVGKGAPGGEVASVFIAGTIDGIQGLFRSDDGGARWLRIDDAAHQFGQIQRVTGDPRLHGRVYFATGGRGIVYGDPQ
jgi:hypothetical protein